MLVLDDETVIAFAIRTFFEIHGFDVDAASEREEALALLTAREYDVVIADLRLTGTGGEEGLEVIKAARDRNSAAGIILLTAYGSGDVHTRAIRAGADLLLQKPRPLIEIQRAVDTLLEERR